MTPGDTDGTVDPETVEGYAERLGLDPEAVDGEANAEAFLGQDDIVGKLDELETPSPPDRDYSTPEETEDPNAAFLLRCDVGGGEGPLAGVDLGVKDNIAVAGLPMTCGSPTMAEYVPPRDATVVRRLIDAGARIVGKTNMDEFALGGSESAMRFRLAQNPNREGYQPGGSSAGSGVAVAEGSVDAALGTDTGGSVRFPASFCGVVGIKPSRGLVSHDGFVQFSKTCDTVGVLGRDVGVSARTLAAMAGPDPRDDATARVDTDGYADAVEPLPDPDGLRIGVAEDLFGLVDAPDERVRTALDRLADAGATLESVEIEGFEYATPAWLAIAMTEMGHYLGANGVNYWRCATPDEAFVEAMAAAGADTETLGDTVVGAALYGRHLAERYDNRYYARGHAGRRRVAAGVDAALEGVDVIAGPTTPMLPPAWGEGYLEDGTLFDAVRNTAPFNLTGHPAVSVPCGTVEDLPVGLQFAAPRFDEVNALRAAGAWESLHGPGPNPE